MNMDDIFSQFGDIFGGGSPFEGFFGGGGRQGGGNGRSVARGSNLRIKVSANPLEEIANGAEKKIKVNKQIICKTCDGTGAKDKSAFKPVKPVVVQGAVRRVTNTILGQMQTTSTCPTCNGEGSVPLLQNVMFAMATALYAEKKPSLSTYLPA
jgi:molecular chaperone DnaJ